MQTQFKECLWFFFTGVFITLLVILALHPMPKSSAALRNKIRMEKIQEIESQMEAE